jgi:hypothetical protein
VYEEGSEVILTSPGFNPKGAFENPYYKPPPFQIKTPLLFTRGDWFVDGYAQAYTFHKLHADAVIYKLSWNDEESYFIQYNITTTEWKDDGLSHPYGVYEEGSEVILTSPGFNPKGAFENPYL